MRLWSLHPRYLDWKGLGANWREGLLGQAIILGKTKGWRNHPQMDRFKAHSGPVAAISYFLQENHREATKRGYNYNYSKILNPVEDIEPLNLTLGQLSYELALLSERLERRDPEWLKKIQAAYLDDPPLPHSLFNAVEGDVEPWEKGYWNAQT
jgi:hypothetical protein